MPAPRGLHLFLGSDRASKLRRIRALEQALQVHAFDRHHVDASALSPAALVALCRQQPAASQARVIIIEQAHRLDRACVAALVQHADAIAACACVVLVADLELSAKHPLAQPPAAFTVERFPGQGTAGRPFALTDALGAGDAGAALRAAHEQLAGGREPLELLGLVAWQAGRWLLVKRLRRQGRSVEQIAASTGLRAWQVERLDSEVARRPLDALQELLRRCWELDVAAKSGRTLPELALEQAIVEACASGAGTPGKPVRAAS